MEVNGIKTNEPTWMSHKKETIAWNLTKQMKSSTMNDEESNEIRVRSPYNECWTQLGFKVPWSSGPPQIRVFSHQEATVES